MSGAGGVPAGAAVSVVVPTYRRPALVARAVRGALAQTLADLEVVVVVDGRDDATVRALGALSDPRLRVVVPPRNLGNADARNLGVAEARAPWVAFLDDDDEWMPAKLAAQLRTARRSAHAHPIVSCRMIARNERQDFVWPRRYPRPGEPVSEYLFTRATPFAGEGMVQTSTILTSRALLARVPFAGGMRRYVDLDWMLRAAAADGVGLEFVPEREPLSVWNMEHGRERISNGADGDYTLAWARAHRGLCTPRAYAALLLTLASKAVAAEAGWRAALALAREAWRDGRPGPGEALTHAANFALPGRWRHAAAARFARARAGRAPRAAHPEGAGA